MIGMILVTHGRLAEELRSAMEHVVGAQRCVDTVCIGPEDDMEIRRAEIEACIKRCDCGDWDDCPHPWVVRYRTDGGRTSKQREQSFGDDLKEAENFLLKVEHDKKAHVFIDPKAGRVTFARNPRRGLITISARTAPSSATGHLSTSDLMWHSSRGKSPAKRTYSSGSIPSA